MKIALINNLYYPYNRGGAEKVVTTMLIDFQNQGHEVFLITTKPKGVETPRQTLNKIYYLPSRFFNLHKLSLICRFFWQMINVINFKKAYQIKKILRQEKPDLIVTHNLMGLGFLTPRMIKKLKIKHEHFLHDIQLLHPSGLMIYGQEKKVDSYLSKIYQSLTRFFFSSPQQVSSPSKWLLEQHKQRGFFKDSLQEVIPFQKKDNTISTKKINNPKNFLFVGQIETHKGILFLIETFKKTTTEDKKLTIIGNGQKLEAAQKLAADDQRITFWGRQDFDKTIETMKKSDCLIIPSLCYENSPTIIAEAHLNNLPVIASNLGGIPEVIGINDHLFGPGNAKDLLNKLT